MRICGLQKTTLLDFPDHIACTVFTSGCDFRCPFCYNRNLVLGIEDNNCLSEKDVFDFLKSREGFLDGVVVCGGEPTLQPDLEEFIRKVHSYGFAVKLDTNGAHPDILEDLLEKNFLQYVSMDIKSILDNEHYGQACGLKNFNNISNIKKSIKLLLSFETSFEFRTTVVPTLHNDKILTKIAQQLKGLAEKENYQQQFSWVLQPFEPRDCLDSSFDKLKPFSEGDMALFLGAVQNVLPDVEIRGLF